jgi:hypothetical protein
MTVFEQVRILLDEANGPVFWTDSHICDALNCAQLYALPTLPREALTRTEWIVLAGQELITIPSTIMIPKFVEDSSQQYLVSSYTDLERYAKDWRGTSAGVPRYFVLHDHSRIRPYPIADENYQFTLAGVPWPTEYTTSAVDPTSDPTLKSAIAHLAASDLLELTLPQLSDAYYSEGERLLNQFRKRSRNTHSHNIKRISPAIYFGNRQQGGIR